MTSATTPVLAATKLHIPALRPGHLHRAVLVELLLAGRQTRFTLVSAAAGSGKTSLLSEWHTHPEEARPFSWISLDRADNDPVRFWDGALAALQARHAGLGMSAHAALHSPGTTVGDHTLPLLINDLAGLPEPVVMVLDDYHLIENLQIHEAVELLIERLPSQVHLVIATRSDPPLPLSRLRARGQLTEVRDADLRFDVAEAGAFLTDVMGLELDDTEIARLHERTEGWAAGLQLAGLSLRGRPDHRQFIESFAGDDQQIVDYLGFEVLDSQPPELREFLIRSSVLDRLSGSLCAAVTGDRQAELHLRRLEHQNAFVVALDSKREWYRYHHLFAELLRHELRRTDPALAPELHRRASQWYRQAGAIHEAIDHATAAHDYADAIDLVTTHWYEFLQRGRQQTVAGWIDRLPAETVAQDPNLCLTKAWLGVNTGRLDEVDRWIEAAGRAAADQPGDELPPLASGVASLRAIHRYMDGNVRAAVEAGRHALELERGGAASPWRPVGCPVLGLSLHWHGQREQATRTLSEAVRIARENGNHLAAMHASGGLAAIEYERGDLATAEARAAEAVALANEHDLGEHWASSLSLAVRGQVLERRDELVSAERLVSRATELARRGVASIEIAYSLLILSGLCQRLGRHEEARRIYAEAREAVRKCQDPGILRDRLTRTAGHLEFAPRARSSATSTTRDALSDAELSVLRLLRSELSQREIASELHLSFNTIKTHTRNIYRKLGVAARAEAISRARDLSLI
jgi:LuxR family maltose regulon positive regulatory protein